MEITPQSAAQRFAVCMELIARPRCNASVTAIMRLVDLPWRDVIYGEIFVHLGAEELCVLRGLSQEHRVDGYLATLDTLKLSSHSCNIILEPDAFEGLVRACEGLRRADLSDSLWLDVSHLVGLLHVRPAITHLDLTRCNGPGMGPDFIRTTISRNLTAVWLRGCDWITADFLSTLVRYNRNLRLLVLADCYRLSDEAVDSIFENRTALSELSLENTTISDRSLRTITERGERIEYLDVRSCPRITDLGLLALRSLLSLRKLLVKECCFVTERGLAPLRGRVDIDLPPRPICRARSPSLQV